MGNICMKNTQHSYNVYPQIDQNTPANMNDGPTGYAKTTTHYATVTETNYLNDTKKLLGLEEDKPVIIIE